MQGGVKNGTTTNGTTVMTFPAGYRPPTRVTVAGVYGGAGATCRIDIESTGDVNIYGVANNVILSLDLSFPTT